MDNGFVKVFKKTLVFIAGAVALAGSGWYIYDNFIKFDIDQQIPQPISPSVEDYTAIPKLSPQTNPQVVTTNELPQDVSQIVQELFDLSPFVVAEVQNVTQLIADLGVYLNEQFDQGQGGIEVSEYCLPEFGLAYYLSNLNPVINSSKCVSY